MKTLLFALVVSIIAIACESANSTAVESFIPGSYVCNFSDSITATASVTGIDSLVIKKQSDAGSDSYEIQRILRVEKMMDSIPQPEKTTREAWTGIYDKKNKVLKAGGKILAFDMKNHLLKIDDKVYIKRE
jgi:hypothetical protein